MGGVLSFSIYSIWWWNLGTKIFLEGLQYTLNYQLDYIKSGHAATIDINWYNKAIEFCKSHIKELEDGGIVSTFGCNKKETWLTGFFFVIYYLSNSLYNYILYNL